MFFGFSEQLLKILKTLEKINEKEFDRRDRIDDFVGNRVPCMPAAARDDQRARQFRGMHDGVYSDGGFICRFAAFDRRFRFKSEEDRRLKR
jgi:hypothetical protein